MGTPHYPPDFGGTIKGIQTAIRTVTTQAQSRKPFSQIKTAVLTLIGSLVVKGGGTITVQDAGGSQIVKIGSQGTSPTGAVVTGIRVSRSNGTDALASYSTPDNSLDFNALHDRAGTIVVSDDGLSQHGLATPWLPIPMPLPTSSNMAAWPQTTSTGFEDVAYVNAFATHPNLRLQIQGVTFSGVAGQFRLMANGTQVGPTTSIPADGNVSLTGTYPVPGWGDTVPFLGTLNLVVQARVTSGSGPVYVQALSIYAVQS